MLARKTWTKLPSLLIGLRCFFSLAVGPAVAVTDSHGNLYTGEVDSGKRVQKFVPVK